MTKSSLFNKPLLSYPLSFSIFNLDKDRQPQKHEYAPQRHRRVRYPVTFARRKCHPVSYLGARVRLRVWRRRASASAAPAPACDPNTTVVDGTVAEVPDRTTGHAASVVESTVLGVGAAPTGFTDGIA